MDMRRILIGALASAFLGQAAIAADLTPQDFVSKASESGVAEVQLGQLAARKGDAESVRAYGERMVTDHTRANTELEALAGKKNLKVTREPGAAHKRALQELGAKSGKDFDAAFAQQMQKDHAEAVALFTSASNLQDGELSGFAKRTLPVLQEHNEKAKHLGAH